MIDELNYVLEQTVTPERKSVLLSAVNILHEYNFHGMDFEIVQMIQTEDVIGTDNLVNGIETVISRGLDVVLRNHGLVTTNPDTRLRSAALNGLMDLQFYDDHDAVLAEIDNTTDPTMSLCNLLAMVTDRDWGDFATLFVDVPSTLLDKLEELHTSMMNGEESEIEELTDDVITEGKKAEIKERLRRYLKHEPKDLIIPTLIAGGHRLGTDAKVYMDAASEKLRSYEKRDAERIAKEFMAIALASPLQTRDFRNAIGEWLEETYDSIDVITAVDVALDNEMAKVNTNG